MMTLGGIDTRAFRDSSDPDNGNINLMALAPPEFAANNIVGNLAAENIITLTGAVTTDGAALDSRLGDFNVTAVKVVLESGFSLMLNETGTATINAGVTGSGFAEADLFMDMSGSGLSANFFVQHDGIPEPSSVALVLCGGWLLAVRRRRRLA
jgi:hypothetical protein